MKKHPILSIAISGAYAIVLNMVTFPFFTLLKTLFVTILKGINELVLYMLELLK